MGKARLRSKEEGLSGPTGEAGQGGQVWAAVG